MKITWNDAKGRGYIDHNALAVRPVFSFEYAWFLVTDETAQYVVSSGAEHSNQQMTREQRQEVIEYYKNWEPTKEVLSVADQQAQRKKQAKEACGARIYAVVDLHAQNNLAADYAIGDLSADERAIYESGVRWIRQMRAAWSDLADETDVDLNDDKAWPEVPPGLVELAQRY